jgi:hypothetical protein
MKHDVWRDGSIGMRKKLKKYHTTYTVATQSPFFVHPAIRCSYLPFKIDALSLNFGLRYHMYADAVGGVPVDYAE